MAVTSPLAIAIPDPMENRRFRAISASQSPEDLRKA
jgi:hypothetical protein